MESITGTNQPVFYTGKNQLKTLTITQVVFEQSRLIIYTRG